MSPKTIIAVAPLGAWAMKSDNPAVPLTPSEIASAVHDCAKAGAAIAHVHARTPDGKPSQDPAIYKEIMERIREKSDIVIQISIGTRGFAIDDALQPVALRPESCSFPLRVLRDEADGDPLADIEYMARRMTEAGVRPELDGSTPEMLKAALAVRERGVLTDPLCFGLVLREPETAHETVRKVIDLSEILPPQAHWWVAKGGKHQLPARATAIALGGHVRVGFEDSVFDFEGDRLAASNAYLVDRIARVATSLGRDPATPDEARRMLSLRNAPTAT